MAKKLSTKSSLPLRTVLSDETHTRLRHMLLTHEIAPGQRITIDALVRELGVSQTPVREALARLESEDLVVKEPLKGYAATELLTVDQMQDLFRFRGLLEPWSAKMAARHITDKGRTLLEKELDTVRKVDGLGHEEAYAAMSEHDARFHTLIAELSGSRFVKDAYTRTHCHLHLFRLYTVLRTWIAESREDAEVVKDLFALYYEPTSGFLAFKEHEAIAAAIIIGEEDAAAKLMAEHIDSSLSRFAPTLSVVARSEN